MVFIAKLQSRRFAETCPELLNQLGPIDQRQSQREQGQQNRDLHKKER
jgi:hypothetical protein